MMNNSNGDNKVDVIICPLNWGIGHATRCIPLIHELLGRGYSCMIASDGRALSLLRQVFPELPFMELPAYDIQYHTSSMPINMVWQLPKMLRAIRLENRLIKRCIQQTQAHTIISDCRYGCYSSGTQNIFISHQLHIKTAHAWATRLVNYWQDQCLRPFDQLWVPDYEKAPGLAGSLSHPPKTQLPTTYLGPISRMKPISTDEQPYDIVAVISGPEPARTRFENTLLHQLNEIEGRHALVCGKPERGEVYTLGSVTVFPFLHSLELSALLSNCRLVVGRSGYTSILDYEVLGCRALLVPTPGQTEQEYLARLHAQQGNHDTVKQSKLNLCAYWEHYQKREKPPTDATPCINDALAQIHL